MGGRSGRVVAAGRGQDIEVAAACLNAGLGDLCQFCKTDVLRRLFIDPAFRVTGGKALGKQATPHVAGQTSPVANL